MDNIININNVVTYVTDVDGTYEFENNYVTTKNNMKITYNEK